MQDDSQMALECVSAGSCPQACPQAGRGADPRSVCALRSLFRRGPLVLVVTPCVQGKWRWLSLSISSQGIQGILSLWMCGVGSAERLKLRMRAQLNKQIKADKQTTQIKAEQERKVRHTLLAASSLYYQPSDPLRQPSITRREAATYLTPHLLMSCAGDAGGGAEPAAQTGRRVRQGVFDQQPRQQPPEQPEPLATWPLAIQVPPSPTTPVLPLTVYTQCRGVLQDPAPLHAFPPPPRPESAGAVCPSPATWMWKSKNSGASTTLQSTPRANLSVPQYSLCE